MEEKQPSSLEKLFKILSGFIILVSFGIGAWAYPKLPEKVPSHWNAAGEVDGYSGALQGAFFIPALLVGMLILFFVIPKIDPKKANFLKMGKAYWAVSLAVILFMSVVHVGTLGVALGYFEKLPSLIYGGIGILFIVFGNYMGKVKHNYMFGIRNPWTLASEEVWLKTHRFAGPLWVISGILFFFTGFIPASLMGYWIFVIIMIIALIPSAYSFLLFNKLKKG